MQPNESLSFWTPVVHDNPTGFQNVTNFIENSLYFGGKRVHVLSDGKQDVQKDKSSGLSTGLKIAAYVGTFGIFPLAMLASKAVYRTFSSSKSPLEEVISILSPISEEEKTTQKLHNIAQDFFREGHLTADQKVKYKFDPEDRIKYLFSVDREGNIKIQKINKKLGAGGFGKVVELEDLTTGEKTALKVAKHANEVKGRVYPHLKNGKKEEAEAALEREVRNLHAINPEGAKDNIQHPPTTKKPFKIVKSYKEAPVRKAYESVEYAGNLDELKVHELPLSERLSIIKQVVRGLKDIHGERFVHMDIKPGNIFYDLDEYEGYRIHIGDFGGASKDGEDNEYMAFTPGFTTGKDYTKVDEATTSATKKYYGQASDMHALGVTLLILLTGPLSQYEVENVKILENEKYLRARLEKAGLGKEHATLKESIVDMVINDPANKMIRNIINWTHLNWAKKMVRDRPQIDHILEIVEKIKEG